MKEIPWSIDDSNAGDLARRAFNTMERDYGYMVASYFGRLTEKMTDEEALAWAEVGKRMKWNTQCPECGQTLD